MAFRNRLRSQIVNQGLASYQGALSSSSNYSEVTITSRCVDDSGVRDGAFTVTHKDLSGGSISYFHPLNVPGTQFKKTQNWTPSYFRNGGGPVAHIDDANRPGNSVLAVMLAAGTNPSKSVVDLPIAIAELRELPDLVRRLGNTYLERIASGNLRWEFGIKPMISDVKKLLDFRKKVDDRKKLLAKLQRGTICRKMTLYTSSVSEEPMTVTVTNSSPSVFQTRHQLVKKLTNRRVWGYIKYSPKPSFRGESRSDQRLDALARKCVLGLTVDASTAWNLMPWSWLADWFGNVGDYLEANRNLVPCTSSVPRICQTIRTEYHWVLDSSNIGLNKGQHTCTSILIDKSRAFASAALPSAELPFLTGRQVGILASLAALRLR